MIVEGFPGIQQTTLHVDPRVLMNANRCPSEISPPEMRCSSLRKQRHRTICCCNEIMSGRCESQGMAARLR
eukprot:751222-Hanusia_phi.AAC.4